MESITKNNHQRAERWLFWLLALLYLGMELGYSSVHQGVWDDDCVSRFFNTQDAFRHPENFVSGWNRPLFVLLFSLPVQAGRWVIPILMPLFTILGAYALFRTLRLQGARNAWLVAPLYLFQSYLLGISRHALTEPLAALLICLGLLFLTQRRWWAFALAGSLLPLARLELAPLLLLWAMPLWKERKVLIPLLGVGMLAWCSASALIVHDFLYPVRAFLGDSAEKSRYGNVPFDHYAMRFIHVVGPVVFLWMMIGLVERIAKMRRQRSWMDLMIPGQLIFGLCLYSLIAAKFSAGNPAGFLRNLVPLSPLAALLAWEGLTAAFAWLPTQAQGGRSRRVRMGVTFALVTLLTAIFFSGLKISRLDLFLRHPYLNLFFILAAGLPILLFLLVRKPLRWMEIVSGLLLAGLMAFFSFVVIPPDRFLSGERRTMELTMAVIHNSPLRDAFPFVNHNWYHWRRDLSPHAGKTGQVTMEGLSRAPLGSIVIWDNHYSHRLGGDVDQSWFSLHPEWQLVFYMSDPDGYLRVQVFERMAPESDRKARLDEMILAQPYIHSLYLNRAQLNWDQRHDTLSALADVEQSLKLDPEDVNGFRLLGTLRAAQGRHADALASFSTAARMLPADPSPWVGMGSCYEKLGQAENARDAYTRALQLAPNHPEANRAMFRLDSLGKQPTMDTPDTSSLK